ncbi:hypothetical protein ANN_23496 [Periplaneta americana]|uniref:Mos1 transposase HTH domain-containing protein n=1 Tax=Periplaneta americana TaxID=6978 RepID=A0ABQ8SNB7_PERAM|nr:hypothetical protein ANN_23496 [Periplaneta americana]
MFVCSALSNLEDIQAGRSDSPMVYRERVRSVGVGPMRSRPNDKRIDTSPYSSGPYLSPPPDTSWRRTNSDSALHQSAMNMGNDASLHSPGSQRRVTDGQLLGIGISDTIDPNRKQLGSSPDGRPRSCCEVPRVPGINIYPSQQEPGTVQIPIGNNTGSLPDLTSFHFPSPLPTPLDQEDPSSSPYSTLVDFLVQSPQAVSPSTLSPTSLSSRQMGRFSFGGSPQDSQGPSPGHSPSTRRRQYHQNIQNLVIGGPQSPTQLSQTAHPADCEMWSVIHFLNARNIKNIKPADIHRQLCEVYGNDAISDGMVRRWVRKFNEGRVSVHDEQRTGRPSLINDDLVRAVDEKIHEDRRFRISSLSLNFPQMSRYLEEAPSRNSEQETWVGVVLLHDNARPHTARDTQNLISKFGWEQIDHPSYSPDLAPSDFHLFLHLKKFLGGQRFDGDEVKTAVREWFASQAGKFYNEGIERRSMTR